MDPGKRVLLLLKPSPARESLSHVLSEQGFEVVSCESTFRAVSLIAKESCRVVVVGLDDLLEEELEAIRIVREERPDTFIIVTFSAVNRRKAQAAIAVGADCYVLEPLRPEEVAAALRRISAGMAVAPAPKAPAPTEAPAAKAGEPAESGTRKKPAEPEHLSPAHSNGRTAEEPSAPVAQKPPVAKKPEPPEIAPMSEADRKLATERLTSVRKLGASVAHEINNPLTTLSGWIQLLLKKANGNQDLRRTLVNMKEEADRIADVVRELTAISEPEMSGRLAIDLNNLAQAFIDCFVNTNGNSRIRVRTIFAADPPKVKVERDLMVRAVCDLLSSDYLKLGNSGSLLFTSVVSADWAEFHVYEPGSQVCLAGLEKAMSSVDLGDSDHIGKDLMLARCQEIITSHGGSFTVECDPREGLIFKLRLPPVEEE